MMTINGFYQPFSSIMKVKEAFPADPGGWGGRVGGSHAALPSHLRRSRAAGVAGELECRLAQDGACRGCWPADPEWTLFSGPDSGAAAATGAAEGKLNVALPRLAFCCIQVGLSSALAAGQQRPAAHDRPCTLPCLPGCMPDTVVASRVPMQGCGVMFALYKINAMGLFPTHLSGTLPWAGCGLSTLPWAALCARHRRLRRCVHCPTAMGHGRGATFCGRCCGPPTAAPHGLCCCCCCLTPADWVSSIKAPTFTEQAVTSILPPPQ